MVPVNKTLQELANRKVSMDELERAYIVLVFELNRCNKTHTAKALGIGLRTLQRKLTKWSVEDYEREQLNR